MYVAGVDMQVEQLMLLGLRVVRTRRLPGSRVSHANQLRLLA